MAFIAAAELDPPPSPWRFHMPEVAPLCGSSLTSGDALTTNSRASFRAFEDASRRVKQLHAASQMQEP